MRTRKKYQIRTIALSALVLLVVLAGGLYWTHRNNGPIPPNIKKQLSFSVLQPQPKTAWRILPKTVAYDSNAGVLTMSAVSGSITLIIAEQAQPEVFSESSQVYPALLTKMNEYDDLQTGIGDVTLTHPKELNGLQTAVMNQKQTLIFVKPTSNLTDAQWKAFFNSQEWQ